MGLEQLCRLPTALGHTPTYRPPRTETPTYTGDSLQPQASSSDQKTSLKAGSCPLVGKLLRSQKEKIWLKASLIPSTSREQFLSPTVRHHYIWVSNPRSQGPHTVTDDHPQGNGSHGFISLKHLSQARGVFSWSSLPGATELATALGFATLHTRDREDILGYPRSQAHACSCRHHQ